MRAKPIEGGRRVPLMVRTTSGLRAALDDAVLKSGRSLAQEAELRLERSFDEDRIRTIIREEIAADREWMMRDPAFVRPIDAANEGFLTYLNGEPRC